MTDEQDDAGHDDAAVPTAGGVGPGSAKVTKQDAKAAKRAARAARREAKAARRAAKQAAKRAAKAHRVADKGARKAERKASREAERAAGAAAKAERKAAKRPRRDAEQADGATEAVLVEVAELVRQAEEPAAEHIVKRVIAQTEPELEHDQEPEPEPEPEHEQEPQPELAEAVGPEPELEPVAAAEAVEPELEPVAAAEAVEPEPAPEPEPEPEPAPPAVEVPPGSVIGAAVDIGANSVHLLVAAVLGHRLVPLADESVFLGLGDRVAADGHLGSELREELALALATYADTARTLGARDISFVGTEPIRRAADAAALVEEVEARTGVVLHVLDHHEEGLLNLLGVNLGHPVAHEMVVIDIGGGSSEVIVARPGERTATEGLRIGCARLTQDFVHGDPPTEEEVQAMRAEARRVVARLPDASPTEMVAVGGTASNLLRVIPATGLDRTLSRRRIAVAVGMLMVQSSAEAAERHMLRPARTRILPAGAVIADAILERYRADRMRVSEDGIREGAVLAAAVAGAWWRDRLESLAAGWRG